LWSSKDISLIIILATVSFVYSMLIAQLPHIITGIVGLNYFFMIGHAIFVSLSILFYEGRRWRFFFQALLLSMLFIPTFAIGTPFDVLARVPMMIVGFLTDFIFNSVYPQFKRKKKLLWLGIFVAVFNIGLNPIATTLNMYLFYPPEVMNGFVSVITLLSPIIIIETIIGGALGYEVFRRINKVPF